MYPDASASTVHSLSVVDESIINYDLLEALLEYIHEVGWLVDWLARSLVGWLAAGWLARCLVGFVGRLVGW